MPKRGKVEGFSRRSRRRFQQKLACIDRRALRVMPLFLTLTYPSVWDNARVKGHLKTFLKRLGRRYPQAAVFWRLELQRRGAPHFHLLVFGVPHVPRGWLARAWYEVVGSGDEKHLRAGTQVQRASGWRQVVGYVAKYIAKPGDECPEAWEGLGRAWGVFQEELLPVTVVVYTLALSRFHPLKRVLRRWLRSRGIRMRDYAWSGTSVYLDDGPALKLLGWFGAELVEGQVA